MERGEVEDDTGGIEVSKDGGADPEAANLERQRDLLEHPADMTSSAEAGSGDKTEWAAVQDANDGEQYEGDGSGNDGDEDGDGDGVEDKEELVAEYVAAKAEEDAIREVRHTSN